MGSQPRTSDRSGGGAGRYLVAGRRPVGMGWLEATRARWVIGLFG
jgi:hypothetical protein